MEELSILTLRTSQHLSLCTEEVEAKKILPDRLKVTKEVTEQSIHPRPPRCWAGMSESPTRVSTRTCGKAHSSPSPTLSSRL